MESTNIAIVLFHNPFVALQGKMDSVEDDAQMQDIEKSEHTNMGVDPSSWTPTEHEEPAPAIGQGEAGPMENAEGDVSSWSQWTWNEELRVYILYFEECYHTYDPEKQVYGKYTGEEENGSECQDSHSGDEDALDIDGEALSGSELDDDVDVDDGGGVAPVESDDEFKEGVSCPFLNDIYRAHRYMHTCIFSTA